MTTRGEAIKAAAESFAQGRIVRDSLPVKEAARLAYTPTGPSIEELERRIAARRRPPAKAERKENRTE